MHPPPRQLRRQAPVRRPRTRPSVRPRGPSRPRKRASIRSRLTAAAIALAALVLGWAILARALAPAGNTNAARFDTIIILGAGIDRDGNPDPVLLSRITEGVHEYERGVAPRILVTGGEDRGHIQAEVMARLVEAQGVPAPEVFTEPRAQNTIQNACFSERIMKQHGWHSAEIVTSPSHLPRAGMIFDRLPMAWHGHAAPALQPSALRAAMASSSEVLHTAYYLLFSQWAQRCSP